MEEKKEGRTVAIWLDAETYERLEQLSRKLNLTRSRLAGNVIRTGLDDVNLLDKMGIFTAVQAIEKAKEALTGVIRDKVFA